MVACGSTISGDYMSCDKDIVISAGDRNMLIAIQRELRTPNDSGGYTSSFATYTTAWVMMEQASGYERYKQNVLAAEATWKFSGLFNDLSGVQVTDRILVNDEYYNVRSIEDVKQRHVTICLRAEKGVVT